MLRCLSCGSALVDATPERLDCATCGRHFEVVAGIPDLRGSVPGFDVEADRRLALELNAERAGSRFEDLLRRYWAAQPDVDPRLVERFVAGDLLGAQRGGAVADQIEELLGERSIDVNLAVEVGCGTAALGAVLARRARHVVVSDVSLSWLVLARHRVESDRLDNVTIVAARADALPLDPASVDLVVAADVIEHVPDASAMVAACCRALRPGGALWVSTPNRYSLTPEPHVRLWGVGFLPRRVAVAYVRRARRARYDDIHTLSYRRLRRLLLTCGGPVQVTAPGIVAPQRARYARPARALIATYEAFRRAPVLSSAVTRVAPLFHGVARIPSAPAPRATEPGSVRYFDQVADGYQARYAADDVLGHALRARRERVRELIGDARGCLLDIGCGSGVMATELSTPDRRFVGVDAAVGMVEEAGRRLAGAPGISFAAGSAPALPFADASFDVAICIGVLERVPDRDRALDEMARVLRPGGQVLVSFPNLLSPYATWRGYVYYPLVAAVKRLGALLTRRSTGPMLLSPTRHWTRRAASALIAARVGPVQAVVPFYFNVLPSPLDELFPRAALRLAARAERLRRTHLSWLGAGFIVMALRSEPDRAVDASTPSSQPGTHPRR